MTVKDELINLTDYLYEHAYLTDYQRKLLIAHIREDIPIPVRFNINTMFTKPVSEPFSSVTNYLAYLVQLGFLTDEEAKTVQSNTCLASSTQTTHHRLSWPHLSPSIPNRPTPTLTKPRWPLPYWPIAAKTLYPC